MLEAWLEHLPKDTWPIILNTWVLYFPYVWLPVVLVTAAIAGHVMVTRALRRGSFSSSAEGLADRGRGAHRL